MEEEDWGFARRHARTALSYSFICVGGEKTHKHFRHFVQSCVFFKFIIVQKKKCAFTHVFIRFCCIVWRCSAFMQILLSTSLLITHHHAFELIWIFLALAEDLWSEHPE